MNNLDSAGGRLPTASEMLRMGPGGRPSGMTSAYTHTIVGVFPTPQIAKTAVGELESSGFSRDQISIVTTAAETPDVGPVAATGSQEDVGEKAAIGGAAGFILGIAALAVPG